MDKFVYVFARHGQTDFNVDGKIQDPNTPQLTKLGKLQSGSLREELSKLGLEFRLIICADAPRTKQTLREIYPDYERMKNVKVDSRLQERYHGDLVGKTKADIEITLGRKIVDRLSWHLYFEGTAKSILTDYHYVNDESLASVEDRLRSLLADIQGTSPILLLGSSVINQYILELLQYNTIGINRPKIGNGDYIDFQNNNELRVITTDKYLSWVDYTTISF
jgi:broad specificity phosphatase PhoE